jgi:hypothetical protein
MGRPGPPSAILEPLPTPPPPTPRRVFPTPPARVADPDSYPDPHGSELI